MYSDFKNALTVLTTVDSKQHPNEATIDYGRKAMNRSQDKVKGAPWLTVAQQGAEYGQLKWTEAGREVKTRRPFRDLSHEPRYEHARLRPLLRGAGQSDRRRVVDYGPRWSEPAMNRRQLLGTLTAAPAAAQLDAQTGAKYRLRSGLVASQYRQQLAVEDDDV